MNGSVKTCALVFLASCTGSPVSEDRDEAAELVARAASLVTEGDLAGAFEALQGGLRAGYPTPSDAVSSEAFRGLLEPPLWRERLRELLELSARESSFSMVRPDEPGEPMILTVRVVAGRDEPPRAVEPYVSRAGIVVGLVHVDAAGFYRPRAEEQDWNPRLFGFGVTDETGTVVVRTIRPGHYAPEYESPDEPEHVHYNVPYGGVLLR